MISNVTWEGSVEKAHRDLKRLLANGPLTAVPKRPSDQQLLVTLAAAQFEMQRTYREDEVNETLKAWLQTFCEPFGIDHVTLRRLLVDSRLMSSTCLRKSAASVRLVRASAQPECTQVFDWASR